jgi:hypothetical protein
MRKIVYLFLFIFLSCSKKELRDDFRNIMMEYQNTYPIKNQKKWDYIYSVYFFKSNHDTLFTITRGANGIPNFVAKNDCAFGVYSDKEIKKFIVLDSFKLSSKLVVNYKRNFPHNLISDGKSFRESITPLATYKLKNGIPIPVKTDTIWRHWD